MMDPAAGYFDDFDTQRQCEEENFDWTEYTLLDIEDFIDDDGEIVVENYDAAQTIMKSLLDNSYVVMLSREEQSYVINYIYSHHHANRNDIVFASREKVVF